MDKDTYTRSVLKNVAFAPTGSLTTSELPRNANSRALPQTY